MQAEGEVRAEGEVVQLAEGEGGPPDFSVFFADEHARLFKSLYFVTGNRADAQELMQDAFLKLWERWDSVEEIDDPTGYQFRVALNGSRMRARAARRAAKRLTMVSELVDPFDEIELREDLGRMLRTLGPRQRAALVLLDTRPTRKGTGTHHGRPMGRSSHTGTGTEPVTSGLPTVRSTRSLQPVEIPRA
jgi:RNA polymerase sigma factor (sigma-70 family)